MMHHTYYCIHVMYICYTIKDYIKQIRVQYMYDRHTNVCVYTHIHICCLLHDDTFRGIVGHDVYVRAAQHYAVTDLRI